MKPKYSYERRVAFSDTDAMGVVHHANYVHYCEEARVGWMRAFGLTDTHYPKSDRVLAVLNIQVTHLRPAAFDDVLSVQVQARRQGAKLQFQYKIFKKTNGVENQTEQLIAHAETLHIPVNAELKPQRPSLKLLEHLEKEPWIETWLSNS